MKNYNKEMINKIVRDYCESLRVQQYSLKEIENIIISEVKEMIEDWNENPFA